MAVTIQMIGEKEFKIKPHGYDQDEVDEFLDDIADEFESLENEIRSLNARLAAQPTPAPAPAVPQRSEPAPTALQEENIKNLLINAQKVCDETVSNAQTRAEEMVTDAREQAEKIVAEARSEERRLQDGMESLRAATADYRARFQRLIDDQAEILKNESELFKRV